MFKKIFAVSVMCLAFGAAHAAEEKKVDYSFGLTKCELIEGDEVKLDSAKIQKGIFITVKGGYVNTAKMMKERMKAAGMKVVDTAEEADYGIQVFSPWNVDFDEIEEGVTNLHTGERMAGIAVNAVLSGGLTLIGDAFNTYSQEGEENRYILTFRVIKDPIDKGNGKQKGASSDDVSYNATSLSNDEGVRRETDQYLVLVDRFIKEHVVAPTPVTTPIE